jgi:hypothetical protein
MLDFILARCESLSETVRVRVLLAAFAFFICAFGGQNIHAQTTAFSYQGTLSEGGVPASGSYEMQFKLFDSLGGPTQIGSTLTRNPVAVTNGGFAVVLDFGSTAFPGPDRFLDIAVRNLSGGVLTPLSPRSQIFSSPYSIRSKTVTGPVTGTDPTATLSVSNAQPGIMNPSPTNLPPAALRSEATATNDANTGVIGIGDGTRGIGVIGVSNGIAPVNGQGNAIGVLGIATATTGGSVGISGSVSSPDGVAVRANSSNGGAIFVGSGGNQASFTVNGNGDVGTSGTLQVSTILSGGNSPLCTLGTAANIIRFCSSSLRYKKQVSPFTGGLDIVNRLHPITFKWKENNMNDLGLGAEDVAKVEPLLTTTNDKGEVEGVKYGQLNVVLINAIKQQQEQIDRQQAQIDALTKLVRRYHWKATARTAR